MIFEIVPKSGENGLNAIYVYQNTTQSAVSARFSDIYGNWNGLHVSDVFSNESIEIGYVDGWLSTSQNMTKILTVFLLFIIVMVAPVFCGEYSGVDQILLSSKYGRTKCATAKVTASVLSAVMTSILVLAVNLLMAFVFYESDGLDCSILFAQLTYIEGSVPAGLSLLQKFLDPHRSGDQGFCHTPGGIRRSGRSLAAGLSPKDRPDL